MNQINIFNKSNFHIINDNDYKIVYSKDKNIFFTMTNENFNTLKENTDKKKITEVLRDINQILCNEPDVQVTEAKDFISSKKIDTLEIIVQTNCNLHCKYCYADGGHYGYGKKILTPNNVLMYLDRLFKYPINSIRGIRFFGGEPSLFPNTIEVVCQYMDKLKDKKIIENLPMFGIITNGTFYSKKLSDLYMKYNFSVTFSIDGPKEVNDELRLFNDLKGSYDIVVKNIKQYIEDGLKNVALEITYTQEHINKHISQSDVINYLTEELGVYNINLVNCRGDSKYAFDSIISEVMDLELLNRELDSMINKDEIDHNNLLIQKYISKLMSKDCYSQKCSSGFESISIFPDGKIYPCHAYLLEDYKYYIIGNYENDEWNCKKASKVSELLKNNKSKLNCKDCWCEYICFGCPQRDIHTKECSYIKQSYELIIKFLSKISKQPELWSRFVNNYNKGVLDIWKEV